MSYLDPDNLAAWDEYCEILDDRLLEIMKTTTCGKCMESRQPSDDGIKGLDELIAWCIVHDCFVDPNDYAYDIGCEDVRRY